MDIAVTAKKELGEKYKAAVWGISPVEDGLYGPQFQVKIVEQDGNKITLWLSVPATERNRTGRCFTAMAGTYPTGSYDPETWIGKPVFLVYAQKKGGEPGDVVLDLIKPRDLDKGEKLDDLVNAARAQDELEAPF